MVSRSIGMLGKIFRFIRSRMKNSQSGDLTSLYHIGEGTRIFKENFDGIFPELAYIGKNCIFAPRSVLMTHDASYYLLTGEYRVEPIHIGDNCFIGYGVIIMPGVTIGDNVIIGAGSIVTKDIPSDSVAVGAPAKVTCTIEEYLAKREHKTLFRAPFAGTLPSEVSKEDIQEFRDLVYPKFQNVISNRPAET